MGVVFGVEVVLLGCVFFCCDGELSPLKKEEIISIRQFNSSTFLGMRDRIDQEV
jgi:hypothetical protein